MGDRLSTYRRKRDAHRTPEPIPAEEPTPEPTETAANSFVIQLHQARRLHWDFRLERDGVLVSWALPKGPPLDPRTNHLAVPTEDHPLDYATFAGTIPRGEYGGGIVTLWDRGTYETEKWTDNEVKVVLHGERVSGRYVLFPTSGKDWMIHRMDPAPPPPSAPLPRFIAPMRATPGELPGDGRSYGYELLWDGLRISAYVSERVLLRDARGHDRTGDFPEMDPLARALAGREAVLDGEVVALDAQGRPSTRLLRTRDHAPKWFMICDLLYVDGESLLDRPYGERRRRLEDLDLTGDAWQTPPYFTENPPGVLATSREQGFPGVIAKRIDSPYESGRRSSSWIVVRAH